MCLSQIVCRKSVSPELPGNVWKIVELDANHRGLCKFGNSDKDQHNLKLVVENIKRLYQLAIEKPESYRASYPDTSGVQTPRTSEYSQDIHHDILEEIQRVALSTANETEQLVMTPSQESQLQDDELCVQDSLQATFDHSATKDLTGSSVQELLVADTKVIESLAQDKLYSQIPFELLVVLLDCIRRRHVETSQSNTWENHELKVIELGTNKIAHLLFRCSGEREKLDIICKLPGVVTISHAVTNLFDATDDGGMQRLLEKFVTGQAKVLITKDCKTRGVNLPSSSMVINYDVPDADAYRYNRQASRAGKAGRFGFAVNLLMNN
ncbi:uncharacterized protein FPRO_03783 [Fusarium proliferatum ET1]|uniref:Helicase C-terminal domain-containing protein n=1 Tax=Fusarium proliferatum (strain ET1) TaxID=1227346 RepID=A0A1L7V526_FUSPR|nr:uncharacterized protein FPRO_03783 [Fusarium proliferatum ET1]CZR35957.1 uncharacterized protein FPRO_03783 [Fusarium proliferatum ET1]